MGEVPDLDPKWPRLLAAARVWKQSLIPKTSTGLAGPTNVLIEAIDAFDPPCEHPRAQRVFYVNGMERCGKCSEWLGGQRPEAEG